MQRRLQQEKVDVSLTDVRPWGALHPVTLVENEICRLMTAMGFEVLSGPEIETDYYNFQALNIPYDHPARDMQDTFYITDGILTAYAHVAYAGSLDGKEEAAYQNAVPRQGVPFGQRRVAFACISSNRSSCG